MAHIVLMICTTKTSQTYVQNLGQLITRYNAMCNHDITKNTIFAKRWRLNAPLQYENKTIVEKLQ